MSSTLNDEGVVVSKCTCQAWRGPTGHCKHVAALLVALRDRERPPKPKPVDGAPSAGAQGGNQNPRLSSADDGDLDHRDSEPPPSSIGSALNAASSSVTGIVSAVPGSVGQGAGKRRRSRRRRRGASPAAAPTGGVAALAEAPVLTPPSGPKLEVLSARQLGLGATRRVTATRDGLDAWLPPGEVTKPCSFEYRLT
ncbi:MAG TPA: SWIM zinc finger family protein, partial [Polyangiales bacterium]|nr:SWIM zinc finger family protein [Polyangiales bacterium]